MENLIFKRTVCNWKAWKILIWFEMLQNKAESVVNLIDVRFPIEYHRR
jgi:hypothetical protein